MTTLALDIETYSSVDIKRSGVYPYAEAPDFQVLLLAYAFDDEPVQLVDLAQDEELPNQVYYALFDEAILKTAFNANFEITCLSRHFGRALDPRQWGCTMVQALSAGLPISLADVGRALSLPVDKQKLSTGTSLIRTLRTRKDGLPATLPCSRYPSATARQTTPRSVSCSANTVSRMWRPRERSGSGWRCTLSTRPNSGCGSWTRPLIVVVSRWTPIWSSRP